MLVVVSCWLSVVADVDVDVVVVVVVVAAVVCYFFACMCVRVVSWQRRPAKG